MTGQCLSVYTGGYWEQKVFNGIIFAVSNHEYFFCINIGEFCTTAKNNNIVIPAQAGIQPYQKLIDSRLRGNDRKVVFFKGLA